MREDDVDDGGFEAGRLERAVRLAGVLAEEDLDFQLAVGVEDEGGVGSEVMGDEGLVCSGEASGAGRGCQFLWCSTSKMDDKSPLLTVFVASPYSSKSLCPTSTKLSVALPRALTIPPPAFSSSPPTSA